MWRKLALVVAGVLAGPLLAIYAFVFFEPVQVLPKLGPAPGYQLVDQDGQRFASEKLRGSLTLYTFGYSDCTGLCGDAVQRLRDVQSQMEQEGVESFILGCTEMPLAVRMYHADGRFIDATQVLAEAAVRFAGAGCIHRLDSEKSEVQIDQAG